MVFPEIIQGGMGVSISGWQLAGAVAREGQMGVVSGISLDEVMIRKLQLGDKDGHIRRALEHFPIKNIIQRILNKFYIEGGKPIDQPFYRHSTHNMTPEREELVVAGNFAEVFLAKDKAAGKGVIGINFLEKIQTDCLASLYGAMLAGVDAVVMGAGIPREIPGAIKRLSENLFTEIRAYVAGSNSDDKFTLSFDPVKYIKDMMLHKPKFFAIVSSNILALTLAKKATGPIDGFIVEAPEAGGHNAPPRGDKTFLPNGEPVYGEKDKVDFVKLKELGIPFWLGGGYSDKGGLQRAMAMGAQGIQVGTQFAMCKESGLRPDMKKAADGAPVFTDIYASPTGFPFKVAQIPGTLSDDDVFKARKRVCNLGYLRERYKKEDGTIGYRCAAEPIEAFVAKGGERALAEKAKCLCNALLANAGFANIAAGGGEEPCLVTAGNILTSLELKGEFTARDVINMLLGDRVPEKVFS